MRSQRDPATILLSLLLLLLTGCRDGVGPRGEAATITLSAAETRFAGAEDERDPPEQRVDVTTGDVVVDDLTVDVVYASGQPAGWLTAVPSRTSTPAALILGVRGASLPPGTYSATVTVSAAEGRSTATHTVRFDYEPTWRGLLRWQQVEGTPTGGTIRALWGQGSTLMAGGDLGVVLRSTDGGAAWTPVIRAMRPLFLWDWWEVNGVWGAGDVRVAVGGYRRGPAENTGLIQRSTDGGTTWAPVDTGAPEAWRAVWGDGSTLVAVGRGIARSMDGGATWTSVAPGIPDTRLEAVWGSGADVLVVGERGTLLRSSDGGETWAAASSRVQTTFRGVTGTGASRIVAGDDGTILRSADGGSTWARVATPVRQALHGIHSAGDIVVAVGDAGTVIRSADGGATWSGVPSGTNRGLRTVWASGSTWHVGGSAGVVLRSTDGGATWSSAVRGTAARLDAVAGDGRSVVAVGEAGTIRRSSDGGATWQSVAPITDHDLRAVFGDASAFVAVGEAGTILRSTDGGATWSRPVSPTIESLLAGWGEGSNMIAVGRYGTILRSTDGGTNWIRITSGSSLHLTGVCGRGFDVVAVGTGGMLRSGNAGAVWFPVPSSDIDLSDVVCSGPVLLGVARWATNTTAGGVITRSVNGGPWAWTGTSAAGAFYQRLGFFKQTVVAVGSHGMVVRSVDNGAEWGALATGVDHDLRGVWVAGGRSVVAVGEGGIILRGAP
jgi:photosystem II stability/assembly factor-like uncharacterized protein